MILKILNSTNQMSRRLRELKMDYLLTSLEVQW